MSPEGYWLFGRSWNRVEVLTAAVACAQSAQGHWGAAFAVAIVGAFASIYGKARFGL